MLRAIAFLLTIFCTSAAYAQRRAHDVVSDRWSEPLSGVRYLERTTAAPAHVHATVIDLREPSIRVVATSHAERWSTLTEFADREQVAIAVNGGFWSLQQTPRGLAAGEGSLWPEVAPDPDFGTFVVHADGTAAIHAPDSPPDAVSVTQAVAGRPVLVRDGVVDEASLAVFPSGNERAPRTAVGLSRDRRTLILLVVDGRQRSSRGMTLSELATQLRDLGANDALNLDGGASSQMFVRPLGGIVNVPARGRWEAAIEDRLGLGERVRTGPTGREVFVRGREQEVINHLGVYAELPAVPVTGHDSPLGGDVDVAPIRPLPPRIRLGQRREVLALLVRAGTGLCVASLLVWAVARRRITAR